jgi:hypothetical protein
MPIEAKKEWSDETSHGKYKIILITFSFIYMIYDTIFGYLVQIRIKLHHNRSNRTNIQIPENPWFDA